jgi:hypothetical protein
MKEFGRQAIVAGGIAFGLRKILVVLPPLQVASLDEGQGMFEAGMGFAKVGIDQPAQALLADDVDIVSEVGCRRCAGLIS